MLPQNREASSFTTSIESENELPREPEPACAAASEAPDRRMNELINQRLAIIIVSCAQLIDTSVLEK
jgi:hypothetical protein